ncbi:antibiotic resistance protein MarC [Sulfolobales archaeon HS-7]|nr:antibiotic resistance protein MarC [Sulfolobales archaeon HS-7]
MIEMSEISSIFIIAIKLFAIMDPFSIIPYILSVFNQYVQETKDTITWSTLTNKLLIVIIILLFLFSLVGRALLDFLGLSPESLEIGGGIILMYLGIDTMGGFGQLRFLGRKIEEALVTPIATPLIVGPGTLTALVSLSVSYSPLLLILGSLIAAALTYISLLSAPLLVKLLGNTGTMAAGRFTAIIIAAFGVQLIITGLQQLQLVK